MPTKLAHLIAFLSVALITLALHRFVYANLRRVILRDYPKLGPRLARIAGWFFVVMDTPFIFIYFRNRINSDLSTVSRIITYPFSVWLAVTFMWAIVLTPFAIWRRREALGVGAIKRVIAKRGLPSGETTDRASEREGQPAQQDAEFDVVTD